MDLKDSVKLFWNGKPCGSLGSLPGTPTLEYFDTVRKRRYELEPFTRETITRLTLQGKRVLEIGCGLGTDGIEIASRGATYTGVDMSDVSLALAKANFALHGKNGIFSVADAEALPFSDSSFDVVYSWGVLHHTPNTAKTINEVYRVLSHGGKACIMLYNRYSLVGLQLYLVYGLLRGRPFISFRELFAAHHESPGTQALTDAEVRIMFQKFSDIAIRNIVTPYDVRFARNRFFPHWVRRLVPGRFGFFKVIEAVKK